MTRAEWIFVAVAAFAVAWVLWLVWRECRPPRDRGSE